MFVNPPLPPAVAGGYVAGCLGGWVAMWLVGWWLGAWWLGGWWLVAGCLVARWLRSGVWWLVFGGWWLVAVVPKKNLHIHTDHKHRKKKELIYFLHGPWGRKILEKKELLQKFFKNP